MTQRQKALQQANARRWALQHLVNGLRDGSDTIADVIKRREPLVADMPIIDVFRLASLHGRRRISAKQYDMTRHAVNQNINLAAPLDAAPDRTIRWCVTYIHAHPGVCGHHHGRRRYAHLRSA